MYKNYNGTLPDSFFGMHILKQQIGMDRVRNDIGNYEVPPPNLACLFPM